jgi:hypothetical protein
MIAQKLLLHKKLLQATALMLGFVGLLAFPIRYPIATVEENPDTGEVLALSKDAPISQTIQAARGNLSRLAFRTNGVPALSPSEPLVLTLASAENKQTVRRVSTTFHAAFLQTSHQLRFIFSPLADSQGQQYIVTLEAPRLAQTNPLPIRRALFNSQDASVEMSVTKSLAGIVVERVFANDTSTEDIYYYWHRGRQILNGDNPYACALDDTCLNHKNPGHFALFYWLAALTEKMGLSDFQSWIDVWRVVFMITEVLTGVLIFTILYRRGQPYLALFGLLFWLLNRWSLYVLYVGQIDFLPIFFLVVSIALFERRLWWSLLCFSISLAFKQLAIFLVPLYLVIVWRTSQARRIRTTLSAAAVIFSVPLLVSLPFLMHQSKALMVGLLFSVTRSSESDLGAPALSRLAHLQGLSSIALMGLIMGILYVVAWRRKLALSTGALAIYFTFLAFNAIVFNQYFVWLMALLPLAISDLLLRPAISPLRPPP